jgi:hypothetical protein
MNTEWGEELREASCKPAELQKKKNKSFYFLRLRTDRTRGSSSAVLGALLALVFGASSTKTR